MRTQVLRIVSAACGLGLLLSADPTRGASVLQAEGIGVWQEGYDLAARGAGWTAIGVIDPFGASAVNPASTIWVNRPQLEAGVLGENVWVGFENVDGNDRIGSTRIPGLSVVLPGPGPLRWTLGFRDLTDGRYETVRLVNEGRTDEHVVRLQGSGGLSELSLTLGTRIPGNRAGLAVRAGIVSGTLRERLEKDFRSGIYDDQDDELRTRMEDAVPVAIGAQAKLTKRVGVGAVYELPTNLDMKSILETETGSKSETLASMDLPGALGGGASIDLGRTRAALDVLQRLWSENDFVPRSAVVGSSSFTGWENTTRIGVGLTRLPDPEATARDPLRRRMTWRVGFTYATLPVRGDSPTEWAGTLGFGLPVQIDRGRIDGLVEFGKRGDQSKDGFSETFFRLGLGTSFQTLRSAF